MAEQECRDTGTPVWTSSSEVWFEDGNIILVAGDEGFRVFRGILAKQSPVFAGMFKLPPPSPRRQVYEGCPVVVMPDAALDMRHFLAALHDLESMKSLCAPKLLDSEANCAISGILQLSAKYEVTRLLTALCDALEVLLPASYGDFRNAYQSLQNVPTGDLFLLANALRLTDSVGKKLLVPILLLCAHQPLSQIIDGAALGDPNNAIIELDAPVKRAVLLGRGKLHKMAFSHTLHHIRALDGNGMFCHQGQKACSASRYAILRTLMDGKEPDGFVSPFPEVFGYAVDLLNAEKYPGPLCGTCAYEKVMHTQVALMQNGQQYVWERLPEIFGVTP
ncbi:hypothetical protein EIP91_002510 [Steccherinum ochraceum]|uniref:BTB domain-containing protein n=1 Tax=Steccherinum ochraceum TaxID=92696 RepID=A0A4R0REJ4_9APHY|nr:hypothetical protein EIP91_002510 [Steccherinum ochraceum]